MQQWLVPAADLTAGGSHATAADPGITVLAVSGDAGVADTNTSHCYSII